MPEVFEFRGVDNLYIAEVICDDNEVGENHGYICEPPVYFAPVAEIGKTTESSNEAHYYDNKAMIVVNSESADTISLTIAPPQLAMLAKFIGKSFDETTGMLVDGERNNKYFAIMYRTKGTDGAYRYVSRLKGTFNIPEESNQTEDDGTDTTNTTVEFTGIFTTHQFTKGKYDATGKKWEKGSVKGVVVDSRYDKVDFADFFTKIQTPDTITAKA